MTNQNLRNVDEQSYSFLPTPDRPSAPPSTTPIVARRLKPEFQTPANNKEFKETLTKEKETNDPPPTNDGESKSDNEPKPIEKKKGGAIKWIVGGAILLLTLGAVNTMNRE